MSLKRCKKLKRKRIKLIFILCLLLSFLLGSVFLFRDNTQYIPINKRENYILYSANDILLKNYLSKKDTLIIFWASWCHYCIEETPVLNDFMLKNTNIPVIVISHDTNQSDLEEYLTKNQLHWFVILDPDKTIREQIDPNSNGIPYLYLLKKDQTMLQKQKGPNTYEEILHFYQTKEGEL